MVWGSSRHIYAYPGIHCLLRHWESVVVGLTGVLVMQFALLLVPPMVVGLGGGLGLGGQSCQGRLEGFAQPL